MSDLDPRLAEAMERAQRALEDDQVRREYAARVRREQRQDRERRGLD